MAKGEFDRDVNRARIATILRNAKLRTESGLTASEKAAVATALHDLTVELADFYVRISPKFERQAFYNLVNVGPPEPKGRRGKN